MRSLSFHQNMQNNNNTNMTKTQYIILHYHDMTHDEIAAAANVSTTHISRVAREHHLTRSDETTERHRMQCISNQLNGVHKSFAYDRMRLMSGQKPRGKRHMTLLPHKTAAAKSRIKYSYNYFADPSDEYVLLYDSDTRRAPHEDYYINKYGFKFISAE